MSRAHQNHAWATLARKARAQLAAAQAPCSRCHRPIDWDLDGRTRWGGTVAHPHALALGGDLLPPVDQLAAMHRSCAAREGGTISSRLQGVGPGSRGGDPSTYMHRPKRKRSAEKNGAVSCPPHAVPRDSDLAHTPPGGVPNPPRGRPSPPWISELLDRMPPGASLPAAMTAAHPRAVGSYGMRAVEWVRREMGVELRWFQRLTMVRQLEHDADGRLTWTYVVQSTPRRVGKSIYLKCLSCWRVDHAGLLGEPQTVLFTGKDLPICKEIHRGAWVWAKGRGWRVARGMGNEEIEKPDGSRWLVRSQNGVYGYPAGMGACDEAWAVPDAVIREGLQPALMDRSSPQLLLTSTAHTKATVLMRRRIRDALDVLDGSGDVLLLLWAAPRDADPSDPAGWRAASPHWDVFRERLIGDAWNQTVSGLAVPDPLEPDPVEGFRAQYLNVWPDLGGAATAAGLVDGRVWDSLLSAGGVPVAVGVESEQGGLPVVAVVSRGADGALVVGVRQAGSMVEAADWCRQVGCRPQVGKSLLHDPVWRDLGAVGMSGTAGELCGAFQQLVADRVIGHDGGDVLSGQVRGAAVRPLAGGRIGVSGRVDAVKAAVWAVGAARSAPPRPRIW